MNHSIGKRVLAVLIAAIVLLIMLLTIDIPVVQAMLSIPLVLVLPGYSITAAAFPQATLGRAERLLFSSGASLAVAIVGSFLLNLTPWGLQAVSWAVLFCGVTIGASIVALLRHQPDRPVTQRLPAMGFSWGQIIQMAGAAVVLVVAVAVARLPVPQEGLQGYSLLWALPADTADSQQINLGICSREFSPTIYRLHVQANDQIIQEWPAIRLNPGETWEESIVAPVDMQSTQPISVVLYRQDDPRHVYRYVLVK